MKPEHAAFTPFQRAKLWYETEMAIIGGEVSGPNEFASYVPVEAREELDKARSRGLAPWFTDRHFMLWAALTEVTGKEEFLEPFGWEENDVRVHLLGMAHGGGNPLHAGL